MDTPNQQQHSVTQAVGNNLTLTDLPLGEEILARSGIPHRGKPSKKHPLGREVFDTKGLVEYKAKSLELKRDILKNQWLDLSYVLLGKANSIAPTLLKKDYGRLVQLLTSAGIAYDKVFPKAEVSSVSNLVVNMFKSLPNDKVLRVIGSSPTPIGLPVEEKPLEVNPERVNPSV